MLKQLYTILLYFILGVALGALTYQTYLVISTITNPLTAFQIWFFGLQYNNGFTSFNLPGGWEALLIIAVCLGFLRRQT